MPLFTVKETGAKTRLIKAKSRESALKHVLGDRFVVDIVSDPLVAAELSESGIKMETEGQTMPPASPPPVPSENGDPQPPASEGDAPPAAEAAIEADKAGQTPKGDKK